MIAAGLKLTLLGMGVVGVFLIILIMLVHLSFKLLGSLSANELIELESAGQKKFNKSVVRKESKVLAAAITAAIAAHRARTLGMGITTDEKKRRGTL